MVWQEEDYQVLKEIRNELRGLKNELGELKDELDSIAAILSDFLEKA